MTESLSYWNQFTDLLCKSMDWFFYNSDLRHERVKGPKYNSERFIILLVIWEKVLKNGQSKVCGRQPLEILKCYGLLKQTILFQIFLKEVFHKFCLVHFSVLCSISFCLYLIFTILQFYTLTILKFLCSHTRIRLTPDGIHHWCSTKELFSKFWTLSGEQTRWSAI